MHVIESLDDLRALVASDDVKIVCVGAKTSLETPEFARAVFGTNERAITTFHKMVASIAAESTRSTVLTFGDADEGARAAARSKEAERRQERGAQAREDKLVEKKLRARREEDRKRHRLRRQRAEQRALEQDRAGRNRRAARERRG